MNRKIKILILKIIYKKIINNKKDVNLRIVKDIKKQFLRFRINYKITMNIKIYKLMKIMKII